MSTREALPSASSGLRPQRLRLCRGCRARSWVGRSAGTSTLALPSGRRSRSVPTSNGFGLHSHRARLEVSWREARLRYRRASKSRKLPRPSDSQQTWLSAPPYFMPANTTSLSSCTTFRQAGLWPLHADPMACSIAATSASESIANWLVRFARDSLPPFCRQRRMNRSIFLSGMSTMS